MPRLQASLVAAAGIGTISTGTGSEALLSGPVRVTYADGSVQVIHQGGDRWMLGEAAEAQLRHAMLLGNETIRRQEEDQARERSRAEMQRAGERWEQASARARELLLSHLNNDQRAEYLLKNLFHVECALGTFVINHAPQENIYRMVEGRPVQRICIVPNVRLPIEDIMLAQKLMLESGDPAFAQTAVVSGVVSAELDRDPMGTDHPNQRLSFYVSTPDRAGDHVGLLGASESVGISPAQIPSVLSANIRRYWSERNAEEETSNEE